MRIISGKFRGKKLAQPTDNLTRPLKDIVKESLFNLLNHSKSVKINMEESNVLDLFSGSGSFGLECISRGAKKVIFCENYTPALNILKKNIKSLKKEKKIEIINDDIFKKLKKKDFEVNFNLIFCDPPFKELKINELLTLINESDILTEDGIIIMHRNKKDSDNINQNYNILLEKSYGLSKIFFIKL